MTYDSLFDIYPLKEIGLDMIPQWLYFKWKRHSSLGWDYIRGTWKVKADGTNKHILEEVKTKESHMQAVMADIRCENRNFQSRWVTNYQRENRIVVLEIFCLLLK